MMSENIPRHPERVFLREGSPETTGIILLNKPQGISSNKALQQVKHLFGAKKAGHTGNLDPLATGMLPICLGEATKVCHYFLEANKCYETTGLLGIKTNTADSTGEVISTVKDFCVSESELMNTLSQFQGSSQQTPSMFSALKHKGRPLYRYARAGIEIERQSRTIQISQLELNHFDGKQFSLLVQCSKGTYIRNLVEDIGDALGVGAHLTKLHRVYTSGFEEMTMYTLEELKNMSVTQRLNSLIPMDKAVDYLASVTLSEEEVTAIRQGLVITHKMQCQEATILRLYNEKQQFIGLGELQPNGELKAKRLLAF